LSATSIFKHSYLNNGHIFLPHILDLCGKDAALVSSAAYARLHFGQCDVKRHGARIGLQHSLNGFEMPPHQAGRRGHVSGAQGRQEPPALFGKSGRCRPLDATFA